MPVSDTTQLLKSARGGDETSSEALFAVLYKELRALAASRLRRERVNHTLEPTALVHEAYLRLVDHNAVEWRDRAHFLGICARLMRQILVDHARRRRVRKKADAHARVTVQDAVSVSTDRQLDVLDLDERLAALRQLDERKATVVELRFFGGLKESEVAEVLHVSLGTVERDWRLARAWLRRELGSRPPTTPTADD